MSTQEHHPMRGTLTLELRDPAGHLAVRRVVPNLITAAGHKIVADLFAGSVVGVPRLMIAVGSNATATTVQDTKLSELARANADAFSAANVTTVRATIPATGSGDPLPLREAGIFVRVGNTEVLYNRVTFEVVHKAANMQLTLSWEVVF